MQRYDSSRNSARSDALNRTRQACEVLRANAHRIEVERELPAEVMSAMHDAKLFRLLLPAALGGSELDIVTMAEVTEMIASVDASAAWCVGQGSGCSMSAAFLDPEPAQRLFGKPDSVLAWGAGAQGKAIEVDGGYRISGRWSFASGSRGATLLGAHCKVFAADGTPRLRADGRPLERTALFPRHMAKIDDDWQVMGLKGTGSDSYSIDNVVIPASDTLDREDFSSLRSKATIYQFPTTMVYASAFGGVMLGIARGILDKLTALAKTKTPRGAPSSLLESSVFQTDLARLEARWRAVRAYHHMTFGDVWESVDNGAPLTLQQRVDARLAATHSINEGIEIVVAAYRAAGATAIFESNPFERHLRDGLAASQQVQGRPTNYATVGRHLLGLPPDSMMFL